jgi:lysophospholipase L1-like esterase
MENIHIAVFFLSFATVIVVFYKPSRIRNYPPQSRTIVAFGDSLIKGIGASEDSGFVSLISEEIGWPIINLGVPGNTSKQGLDRIHDVLNEHPGVVMVLFGGNDYLHGVPIDETFNNLELIVEKIQRKGAVVILLGIQGGILEDPFESRFRALARKKGALYVPNVLDGLIGNTDYMSDEIHPNDKGQRVIADKIYPVLDRVL